MKFILYSRSDCPLCEAMEEELGPFIEKYNISVQRQYIDNQTALQELYADKVPVLTLHDKIVCNYFLDADTLRDTIKDNN
ncbi:MAG: glutaredoxin family protein [Gammaproteobacteria bacterium]|nr:glutaredoxin family protein [Gammaproteobacteria bacterium]NNJ50155.1 glutaredoxin family protein [Gammaproteobacteria bacterium]